MSAAKEEVSARRDGLVVAGREYRSRLLVGKGKYKDFDETRRAIEAGREAYLAGRIPRKRFASASSPIDGTIF